MVLFSLILSFVLPLNVYAAGKNKREELDFVKAKSVILMSIDTGDVLYAENEYEHLFPASVTKIMTILLVLEAIDSGRISMSDEVSASAEAVSMGGSQIWLEVGEKMTVEELFKAVVIASANDACTALGEYVAGSSGAFVDMMNERAKQLGLKNTNFENCNGLDDTAKNHYSCAYDLAVISVEVMKHKTIEKYSTVWLDSLRDGKTELNNTNKLVNTFNGITGLKTGTTSNAGFCVSATARRDGMSLVAVVLGSKTSEDRFGTAAGLLEWGFANYELKEPEIDNTLIKEVKILQGDVKSIKPVTEKYGQYISEKGIDEPTYNYNVYRSVKAPVSKGDSLGHIDIIGEKGIISSIELISPCDISKISTASIFKLILTSI